MLLTPAWISAILVLIGLGMLLRLWFFRRQLSALFAPTERVIEAAPELHAQVMSLTAQLDEKVLQVEQLQDDLRFNQNALSDAKGDARVAQTRLEEQAKQFDEKYALLAQARAQMKLEFEQLAHQILEEKRVKFQAENNQSLEQILKPFKEQLGEFKKKVEETHQTDIRERATLKEHIEQLAKLNQHMSEETRALTQALKGNTKTQGNWGELILENLLEQSGLRKGEEFSVQGSFQDAEGRRLRPDVIVNLPDARHIIVDSKVSLTAYERAINASEEVQKALALKEHVISLKNHIDGLARKSYTELIGTHSLDFILMFIPLESAFVTAMEADASLFNLAYEKGILLVTPTTLLATLRTIANQWRFVQQNQNALDIAERAAKMYDKFAGFVDDMQKLGKELEQARGAYDAAMAKLHSGPGNLVRQSEQLVELGVKAKKQIALNGQ